MSTPLLAALAREADEGRSAGPDGAEAIRSRVRARVRRRRVGAIAGYAAASLAVAGAVVINLNVDYTAPPRATEPPVVLDAAERRAGWDADALLADSASRSRTADAATERQAALACDRTAAPGEAVPCAALWVADRPLVRIDPEQTRVTARVGADVVRIDVRWALRNVSARWMLVDQADALVALVTEPSSRASAPEVTHGTVGARSLWSDDRHRFAHNVERRSLAELAPGAALRRWDTFVVARPVPGEPADPLWDVATGASDATLTIHMGLAREEGTEWSTLVLDASLPLDQIERALAADSLAASFRPRARGEETPADAQAALLCTVPEELRASTFEDFAIPLESQPQACDAGWVDGPVLADAGVSTVIPGEVADSVAWSIVNTSGSMIQVTRTYLQVEAAPARVRGGDTLTQLGTAVVTPSSAWRADGRRLGWLSNVRVDLPLEPGSIVGGGAQLFPGMLGSNTIVDVDAIAAALRREGTVTAVAAVPFVEDTSRVLLLETPLSLEETPIASP